jgi:NADPH:quinone reductase-like Zn-dependent oxidoreductase
VGCGISRLVLENVTPFPASLNSKYPVHCSIIGSIVIMATRTHSAVVYAGAKQPFEIQQRTTASPEGDEVLIRQKWTASTPLDLHRADGGFLTPPGHVMGTVVAGAVEEVGPDTKRFKPGDEIFGWSFHEPKAAAYQDYVTAPEWMFTKVRGSFSHPLLQGNS